MFDFEHAGLSDLFQQHLHRYISGPRNPGTLGRFWEALVSMGIDEQQAVDYIHSLD